MKLGEAKVEAAPLLDGPCGTLPPPESDGIAPAGGPRSRGFVDWGVRVPTHCLLGTWLYGGAHGCVQGKQHNPPGCTPHSRATRCSCSCVRPPPPPTDTEECGAPVSANLITRPPADDNVAGVDHPPGACGPESLRPRLLRCRWRGWEEVTPASMGRACAPASIPCPDSRLPPAFVTDSGCCMATVARCKGSGGALALGMARTGDDGGGCDPLPPQRVANPRPTAFPTAPANPPPPLPLWHGPRQGRHT